MERLTAGHQHLEGRARLEEVGDRRPGDRDLFEVVEDQEHLPLMQPSLELVHDRSIAVLGRADHTGDRGDGRLRVRRRLEVDEEGAIAKPVELADRDAEREAGLA